MLEKKNARAVSFAPFRARPSVSLATWRDQRLDAARIELRQVLEGEHQVADLARRVAVGLVKRSEEARLGLTVEGIEDLGHELVRVAPARLRDRGHELVAQRLLDVFERFLLHRLHAQHAVDDVDREVVREDREHARGMVGAQARQDDGDGLRVFAAQVVRQDLGLDMRQPLPHAPAGGALDVRHDRGDLLARKDLGEEFLGAVEAAGHGAAAR